MANMSKDSPADVDLQGKEIGDLTRAFQLFSKEMGKLERSYAALKREFEEKNLELQSKVSELDTTTNYLRGILGNMAQGILFIEGTGEITTYNDFAATILGLPADEVLGHPYHDCFPDDLFGVSIRESLSEQKGHDWFPSPYTTPEGVHLHLELSLAPANLGLILLIRDRTEIRRLQSLAARSDRLAELGEMAAAVAHEIRNPLGGIKGFAALLERDLEEMPHQAMMAASIVEGAATLDRLVSNILHYARPMELQLRRVSLGKMVGDVIDLVRADPALAEEIDLRFEKPQPAIYARLDAAFFKSALLNLVVNAIQSIEGEGEVAVGVGRSERGIHVTIRDSGCGIAPENVEKIFSPFFTTKEQGNGLGLAEVHKVIQAHGGSIDIDSQLDLGTTFTLHLGASEWQSKRS